MPGLIETISSRNEAISIEVIPPSRGSDPDGVLSCVDSIGAYSPSFVSVTDHPAGHVWVEHGGVPVAVSIRNKPGTFGLCVALRQKCGVHVVPHVVCLGNDRFRAEDELIDLRYAGFSDLFVIRGDERFLPFVAASQSKPAGKGGAKAPDFQHAASEAVNRGKADFPHAIDMVEFIQKLNGGSYAGGTLCGKDAGFTAGVAAYPEKHHAALNPESDMRALAAKVAAGAKFIITQMVFDAKIYKDFVAKARTAGINVPIIPGVKPVTKRSSLAKLPGNFFIDIPLDLAQAMEESRTPAEEKKAGLDFGTKLVRGLYDVGAPCVHFFTMDRAADTMALLSSVFGSK